MQKLTNILNRIKAKNPIIFHITNTVTINDCANITLSIGASPLMSFCEEELEDILSFSSALVINIGTMDKFMTDIVVKAGKIANGLHVPVILDPVGAGASKARKELTQKLLKEVKFAVIKGNSAEIKTLLGLDLTNCAGVDSKEDFSDENAVKALANRLSTVIAMSGKTDIISDGKRVAKITNGTPLLACVSGTGCMSASLCASGCGASGEFFESAILGISLMGIAGEMSFEEGITTNGSLKVALLDNISKINSEIFMKKAKIELF